MRKFTILRKMIIALFLSFTMIQAKAQGDPPPPPPPPVDPGEVPIDGGIALLLAAGIGYGAKKAYDFRKGMKQREEE